MTNIGHIRNTASDGVISAPGRIADMGTDRTPKTDESGSNRLANDADRVEISEHARHLANIKAMPDTRPERIDAAREALESGDLDTEEALRNALEIMIEESDLL